MGATFSSQRYKDTIGIRNFRSSMNLLELGFSLDMAWLLEMLKWLLWAPFWPCLGTMNLSESAVVLGSASGRWKLAEAHKIWCWISTVHSHLQKGRSEHVNIVEKKPSRGADFAGRVLWEGEETVRSPMWSSVISVQSNIRSSKIVEAGSFSA